MSQTMKTIFVLLYFIQCGFCKYCCLSNVGFEEELCPEIQTQTECIAPKCQWICWLKVAAPKYKFDIEKYNEIETVGDKDSSDIIHPAAEKALEKLVGTSNYFANTNILTWDKYGVVEEFKYDEALITNPALIDPMYQQIVKEQESDIQAYLKQHKTKSELLPKLTLQILQHKLPKLIPKPGAHSKLISKPGAHSKLISKPGAHRRRLTHGTETETGAENLNKKPYAAVGVFGLKKFFSDINNWRDGRATGTIIASKHEGSNYYDYILSAGHNFVSKTIPVHAERLNYNKGVTETHLDGHPERKFSTKIRFWRALNIDGSGLALPDIAPRGEPLNPTHPADTFEKIWVAKTYVDERDEYLDYSIVKFKRSISQGQTRKVAFVTASTDYYTRMRLITYRFGTRRAGDDRNQFKQKYVPNVVPLVNDQIPAYQVIPRFTRKGMSGSGLFQERSSGEVLHYLVAIHVGGSRRHSEHLKITKAKRYSIQQVITRQFDVAAEKATQLAPQTALDNAADGKLAYDDYYIYYDYNQYPQSIEIGADRHLYNENGYNGYEKPMLHNYHGNNIDYNRVNRLWILFVIIAISLLVTLIYSVFCVIGGFIGYFCGHFSKRNLKTRDHV